MIIKTIIQTVFQLLTLVVIIDAILSFFVPYNNKVRYTLDRIVSPLLTPIRRIIPPIYNLDCSPEILLVLLQIVQNLLLWLV
jgi:YggT family protein